MVAVPGRAGYRAPEIHETSDPMVLQEALAEAVALLNSAKKPVVLADVEC
jgi:hypothetical protein